jgi:hypothetical protein
MAIYKVADYVALTANMTYTLPEPVLIIIKKLAVELGVSTTYSEPIRDNNVDRDKRSALKRGRLVNNNQNGWDKQIQFKTTEIVKKEGIDKLFTDIKGALNKLSIKNYETIEQSLFDYIDNVYQHPDFDNEPVVAKIASLIFDFACINKTHSELYAKLYRKLTDNRPEFSAPVYVLKATYVTSFDNIVYVDPDADYNRFCEITKENDRRKSISVFLVNLMNNKLISTDDVVDILTTIIQRVVDATNVEGQMHYVEELIEVLNVYVKAAFGYLREHSGWNNVSTHIYQYATYKAKEHAGLSSRIIFKYMDMKDIMVKSS